VPASILKVSEQTHSIQKLTVEVGLPSQDGAYALQSKISDARRRLILSVLQEVFDKYVSPGEIVQVNKMEFDLGRIHPDHLDYELPEKLKAEAEQALEKIIHEIRTNPESAFQDITVPMTNGKTITVQAGLKKRSYSLLETLLSFLEYGVMPGSDNLNEKRSLKNLFAEAMTHHPEELRRDLMRPGTKKYIFRRIATQLPDDQLQYLAAILGCAFSSKLPGFFEDVKQYSAMTGRSFEGTIKFFSPVMLKYFFWEESLYHFNSLSAAIPASEPETSYIQALLDKFNIKSGITFPLFFSSRAKEKFSPGFRAVLELNEKENEKAVPQKNKSGKTKSPSENEIEVWAEHEKGSLNAGSNESQGNAKKGQVENQEDSVSAKNDHKEKSIEEERRENFPESPEADDGIYIHNAGMVLLHPYLLPFFRNMGLVEGKEFRDDEARWKAVHLLQWLVFGDRVSKGENEEEISEHEFILNKILCGMDIAEPVPVNFGLSDEEKLKSEEFLLAIMKNWPALERSSVHALRTTFLEKEGRLQREGSNWNLFIPRNSAVDILIDRLPWAISMIRMPWDKTVIYVEW
jgi:hypothetical protein